MRILVTGAAGFIGSHLAERLLADGHAVVGVDCLLEDSYPASIKADNWRELRLCGRFEGVQGDLRCLDLRDVVRDVDVIVNEAAMSGMMRSWANFRTYTECNVIALQRLLHAARSVGIERFVQISTSSVYGYRAVCDERAATTPFSPYGVTKLAAENLLHAYAANYAVPGIVLRYFSVYGPRQRPDMAYHRFCEALLDGTPLVFYGDGLQSRTNTFVSDCVEGTVRAIEHARVGETYNIAGACSITLREAVDVLAEDFGAEPVIEYRPARPGDQLETAGVTGKAARDFGYEPAVEPGDGLRIQAAWHRARRAQGASAASRLSREMRQSGDLA